MKKEMSFAEYFDLPSRRGRVTFEVGAWYRDEEKPSQVFCFRGTEGPLWETARWSVPRLQRKRSQALTWDGVYGRLMVAGLK